MPRKPKMKDSLAFKLSLQKLFDCLLSWPEQKEKKNGYYGFFIILKNPLETEKKILYIFWQNSNFRTLLPCSLACLNGQEVTV